MKIKLFKIASILVATLFFVASCTDTLEEDNKTQTQMAQSSVFTKLVSKKKASATATPRSNSDDEGSITEELCIEIVYPIYLTVSGQGRVEITSDEHLDETLMEYYNSDSDIDPLISYPIQIMVNGETLTVRDDDHLMENIDACQNGTQEQEEGDTDDQGDDSDDQDQDDNSDDAAGDNGQNTGEQSTSSNPALEAYLKANADYVHNINGFYIVGSAARPNQQESPGATGKDIFDHAVRLFSNYLDQDQDGMIDPDKKQLNARLAKTTLFISGPLSMVDKISFAREVEGRGLYGMSMQTDSWPYVKGYDGTGWTINRLNSSTWRPETFNALWEEVFHTVTEAFSRSDREFRFTPGGALRRYMDADISAGTYDISEQNREENGNYDRVTAVNEYIHQIWAINFAGQSSKLNSHQRRALDFMISKGVPMQLSPSYSYQIGSRVK